MVVVGVGVVPVPLFQQVVPQKVAEQLVPQRRHKLLVPERYHKDLHSPAEAFVLPVKKQEVYERNGGRVNEAVSKRWSV